MPATAALENPTPEECCELLSRTRTIAVVGLSPLPSRPSYGVARAMQRFGFRIIPVRPRIAEALGEKAYASLRQVPGPIDLVNVFRAAPFVGAIVDECIELGLPAIWIQEGIVNQRAFLRAREAGMFVVMNRCIWRDYTTYCT